MRFIVLFVSGLLGLESRLRKLLCGFARYSNSPPLEARARSARARSESSKGVGALRGLHALRKASGRATQQFSCRSTRTHPEHRASVPLGHRKMAKNPASPVLGRRFHHSS